MATCPICGAMGEDLIFKFYCSNNRCQNFHKSCKKSSITNDISLMLHNLWECYNSGELEEEFLIKFFSEGGRFSLTKSKNIRITYPGWLKNKMDKN